MPTGGIDIGIGAALADAAASVGSGVAALGIGADTAGLIGTGLVGAGVGAGLGAGESALTGGNPLTGAEFGGITGGAIAGAGPAIGGALGSTTAGDALAGAAGGAVGGAATGGNILNSTLGGAASGGVAGALSGGSTDAAAGTSNVTGSAAPASGGGAPAGAIAPAGVGGAPGGDVTLPSDTTSNFPTAAGAQSSNFSSGGAGDFGTGSVSQLGSSNAGGGLNNTLNSTPSLNASTGSGGAAGGGGNISGGSNITGAPQGGSSGSFDPVTGAATKAPNSLSQLFNSDAPGGGATWGNIGKALGNNAGLLTATAGLGNDVVSAIGGPPKGTNALTSEAQQLQTLGTQNASYLQSGTLPQGVQAGINQATQSALAAVRSKYASMGMSGSSAEQQDIAAVQQNAQAQGAQIALQLMNSGVSELGLSGQIYSQLINNTMASDRNFASAFTNLASAAGGGSGSGGTTIKVGGAA